MLSICIEFLTGLYVATDPYHQDRPEWPPHPGRLFTAMSSVYFEGGQRQKERAALEWLETCAPPLICYDKKSVFSRETVHFFVPVNDKGKIESDGVSLTTVSPRVGRMRKPRTFPTTVAGYSPVTFVWADHDASAHLDSINAMCSRVHRLGHSSSLVHLTATLDENGVSPTLVPHQHGYKKIRWTSPGTLKRLEQAYDMEGVKGTSEKLFHVRKARLNAVRMRSASYVERPMASASRLPKGQFLDMCVLAITNGPNPDLIHAREVARAAKAQLFGTDPGEPVTGLDKNGKPTTMPHISIVPLAFTSHRHADGHVRGIAVVMPCGLDMGDKGKILSALQSGTLRSATPNAVLTLNVHGFDKIELSIHEEYGGPETLDMATWLRPSRMWASVTPIVLDKAPHKHGDEREKEVVRIISHSCTLQGLPEPSFIATSNVPYIPGPPLATVFPRYEIQNKARGEKRGDDSKQKNTGSVVSKIHTHALITFDEEIEGPLILGAGRYNGYGLCKPVVGVRKWSS